MQFLIKDRASRAPAIKSFPAVLLVRDNWDDFGYKSLFDAILYLSADHRIALEQVKIINSDQASGQTKFSDEIFQGLDQTYCSLGQDIDYYKRLYDAGPGVYEPYFRGLRDVIFDPEIYNKFKDKEGFLVSLNRFSSTSLVLAEASKIFYPQSDDTDADSGLKFTFETKLDDAATPLSITFDFLPNKNLPSRINTIIGYNGTGKTQLLASLAIAASGYGYESRSEFLEQRAGRFPTSPPPTSHVVVISYSAFDRFEIPGKNRDEKARIERDGTLFGFAYCGLRERVESNTKLPQYRLKSHAEIKGDFVEALRQIVKLERSSIFAEIMSPVLRDASFQRVGLGDIMTDEYTEKLPDFFDRLSSGHKVVLKITAEMTAAIDGSKPSLVVIDEPEAHLHPPLVAALLQSIRICLDKLNGYAVIAAHSPVVLQELPGKYIRKIYRSGNDSSVALPSIETFGENIGMITQEVFNLDDSFTDWHDLIRKLVKGRTLEEITNIFDGRLSFPVRSYIMDLLEDDAED